MKNLCTQAEIFQRLGGQALKKGTCSHRAAGPPGFGARSAVSEAAACCWVAADRAILDLDLIIPRQAVLAGSQVYQIAP